MSDIKRKASNILINPKFQFQILSIVIFLGIFLFIFNLFALQMSFMQLNNMLNSLVDIPPTSKAEITGFIDSTKRQMLIYSFTIFSTGLLIFIILAFRITHNAAGALYRFKAEFMKMEKQGKLHHFQLRKGDFFKDVEESFNRLVSTFDKKN